LLKAIQRAGQWFFLKVESLFNLAFGDRLNPLYYLGPISYFMFWIVVATGLVEYIYFKTSVSGAYDSVEALTAQRWFGGILRSLHRYASDGMVLTMALHLLRHFAFDRYRSFRWFSWITGLVVLWLVYAAGINGYMLPWDKYAQFVVVATMEWFDWLPVFNGTLIRNFIFTENVNDRLFSLLSFLHIGIPLGILVLLWVHTQRVPQAKTSPPRPIAITLVLALVALSVVKPAVSQGPADLSKAVTTVDMDWFYLSAYPLIYAWSPGKLWALVGGATLFFALLPWLPPKLRRGPKEGYHVMVRPDNRIVAAREGETLLDAGLREGLALPYECRNGGCGVCKATIAYGTVDYGAYQESVLTEDEKRAGKALLCCATPLSDLELEYAPTAAPGGIPVHTYIGTVVEMKRLSPDVMQVFLQLPQGEKLRFYAGQYINIILDDGAKRSFSFATAPHVHDLIELQVRLIPGGRFTTQVFNGMKAGDLVRFEGPLGAFFLREDSTKPIIFVAGATGFAPVKSMVEHAFHTGLKRRMILYWGARSLQDLYLGDLAARWAREHSNFTFVPVLSEPKPEDHWTGRTGLVHEAILEDFPDLSGHQVYACGSVAMVEAAHPAFVAHGMSEHDCFSDAFKLAPQISSVIGDLVKLGGGR
jgi:CDP-4-dehydro-6-deoxyglucose reductase